MCFPEFTGLDVKLAQIIQCFEIFFNGQRFIKALNGIVRTSHTLGTQAVIFKYLKVLFGVFFVFLPQGFLFSPQKKDLKKFGMIKVFLVWLQM